MNTRTIVIGVVIIAVVLIAGYLIFANNSGQPAAGQQATTTASTSTPQVQAQDVKVGTGKEATPNSIVSVLYEGKFQDGTIFDSSAAHGNQPLRFQLGAPGLIAGFQIGVNGMKEGGERLILVPPELGYGNQAVHENPQDPKSKIVIPANTPLIFDIKLVKVEAATTTPTTP